MKSKELYPETTKKMSEKKAALTLGIAVAFMDFSKSVFKEVALSEKQNNLLPKR